MLKQSSYTKDYTVKLLVGPEEKVFKVNTKLLLRSEFFSEQLETHLKTDNMSISVPKASAKDMQLYLDFIHLGPHQMPEKTANAISSRYHDLACIYNLSKPLRDTGTQNDVAIAMLGLSKVKAVEGTTYPPNGQVVCLIYSTSTASDPIRRMMVDLWTPISKGRVQSCGELPDEFMRDLLRAMADPSLLDSKGLRSALVALMGTEEVMNLSNRALGKGPSAYMK